MLARIENGVIVEMRDLEIEAVPEHKRDLWRPVVYEGDGSLSNEIIEPDRVRIVRSHPAPTQSDYAHAIQKHIDQTARQKGYADGVTLASYITSSMPAWQGEAAVFVPWRDLVWTYALSEMAKVQSGQRAQPTIAELIAELPTIEWPD